MSPAIGSLVLPVRDRLGVDEVEAIVESVVTRGRFRTTSAWSAAWAAQLGAALSRPVVENPLHAVWTLIVGDPASRDSIERDLTAAPGRLAEPIEESVTWGLRRWLAPRMAWAVPDDRALATIGRHSPGGVVEVMAGLGYWARLLRQRGVDVVASDLGDDQTYLKGAPWADVSVGDAAEAAASHPDRTSLICWPPMTGDAARAVRAYHDAGGRTVIYIGEDGDGCTGDSDLHQTIGLGDEPADEAPLFVPVDSVVVPQWWGLHDSLWVCVRTDLSA